MIKYIAILIVSLSMVVSCGKKEEVVKQEADTSQHTHPNLILTIDGVKNIKAQLGALPILDSSIEKIKNEVDAEIALGIDVPTPKDLSGGYTHERHKKNFFMLQKAGVLYQVLADEKYGVYVRDMFLAYAKIYNDLPVHPQPRSYARGKLFWQCLNDSNWLVYASQAYDCVYEFLSKEERETLEADLFKPMANFLSTGNPQFFNRVHNHSTWGNVAVGMIALVMDDEDLLNKALYGLKEDGLDPNMKDNDGGFIKSKDGKAGFYANLDEPFSPDGYYTEGPYYQRYAMYPFLIFAQALQTKKPETKIFEYKNSVLLKGVDALLNLSDKDGEFFALNDAQKGMSYYTGSLIPAVDMAYYFGERNPELLTVAKKQNKVAISDAGLAVALAIKEGKEKPFVKKSIELTDGPNGKQGAVGVLRSDDLELVYKYTAHGLSHGHYDKLSFSLFENGNEIIQDYGMGRYVNIEQKGGGNYLKENKTWAKQSIAHNTLVQDKVSHFGGEYSVGSEHHSNGYFFDNKDEKIQIASAKEVNAYPGTEMHRTIALVKIEGLEKPVVLDLLKVKSKAKHHYDFPLYYLGQLMKTNADYKLTEPHKIMGEGHGYQHLYNEAEGKVDGENLQFSWLNNNKFYSYTSVVSKKDNITLARIGATDPHFNLRKDPALIISKENAGDALFVSTIESHGSYSPVTELALNAYSSIASVKVLVDTEEYTVVEINTKSDKKVIFGLSNLDNNKESKHSVIVKEESVEWTGPFLLK